MKKFFNRLILITVASLLGGCATIPPVSTISPGTSLSDICKKYSIQWQFDNVTQVVLLDYKEHKAKALIGSPTILLGK